MNLKTAKIVWRPVTSANPAKPAIVAAIREAAGVGTGKVTTVKISKDGTKVCGHVLTREYGARHDEDDIQKAGWGPKVWVSRGTITADAPR